MIAQQIDESRPSIDAQRDYYNQYFRPSSYINALKLERCIAILSVILELKLKDPRILDVGCGAGWLTSILGHIGPTLGIDLSDEAVGTASQKYTHVTFRQMNMFDWHGDSSEFDLIVAQEALEHFENQEAFVDLAFQLLREGGYLILTTPNARTFNAMPADQRRGWAGQPIENWLDPREVRALLSRRFREMTVTTVIPKYGHRGIYKLWGSAPLKRLLDRAGLGPAFQQARLKLGYGLHILAVARRPKN
jgi:2-polyprenyl-3-methyl-5-hydroxy-6-metoxy-1,4-benzoquinol methylase